MTPAALPDGPPSRKGPLCSVLSPLPTLYFYCKSPASPYAPEPIPKNSSSLRLAQPMECLFVELYEYNSPLKSLISEGLFFAYCDAGVKPY